MAILVLLAVFVLPGLVLIASAFRDPLFRR